MADTGTDPVPKGLTDNLASDGVVFDPYEVVRMWEFANRIARGGLTWDQQRTYAQQVCLKLEEGRSINLPERDVF